MPVCHVWPTKEWESRATRLFSFEALIATNTLKIIDGIQPFICSPFRSIIMQRAKSSTPGRAPDPIKSKKRRACIILISVATALLVIFGLLHRADRFWPIVEGGSAILRAKNFMPQVPSAYPPVPHPTTSPDLPRGASYALMAPARLKDRINERLQPSGLTKQCWWFQQCPLKPAWLPSSSGGRSVAGSSREPPSAHSYVLVRPGWPPARPY